MEQSLQTSTRPLDTVAEVAHSLTSDRALALTSAVRVLREFYDPPAIFLFGSSAKDMAGALSDLDLLLRMPSRDRRGARGTEFKEVFLGSYPRVDLVVFTDEEVRHHLANPYSFLSSVMASARPLFLKSPRDEPLLQGARARGPGC